MFSINYIINYINVIVGSYLQPSVLIKDLFYFIKLYKLSICTHIITDQNMLQRFYKYFFLFM